MNKSSHVKQFLLPGCECYCNAAPIPFDGYASIPRSRPRQLSSAPWWCLTVSVPVRSGLQDMSTIPRSGSMCVIWLGRLLLNIPGASVRTFRWGGVPPATSSPGCSNLQQGYNQFRFLLFLVSIPNIYAFHRYTRNSACLYFTQECQFQKQVTSWARNFHFWLDIPPTLPLHPVIPDNACHLRITAAAGT